MEADISIWRKTGHFYFALTRRGTAWKSSPFIERACVDLNGVVPRLSLSTTRKLSQACATFMATDGRAVEGSTKVYGCRAMYGLPELST